MSSYFERLMVASGVRVGAAPAAEGQGTPTARESRSPAASDLEDGCEVSDVETPLPSATRPEDKTSATAAHDETPRAPTADINTAAPPPGSPERFSSSSRQLVANRDIASASREEILAAVMSWISVGQAMPANSRAMVTAPGPASDAELNAASRAAQRLSTADRSAGDMTAKVPALRTELPSIREPAETPSSAPTSVESDARPPSISIGAIHVRVEAPPPDVMPARPAPPAEHASVPATWSASALKLRRHYVLPH